jgi:hypothetical protein
MGLRAEQLSDGNAECPFLDMFGRPTRDTPYEQERNSELSLRQALYFINSEQLEGKVSGSPRIKRLLDAKKADAEIVDELYLMTFSRFPSDEESSGCSITSSKRRRGRRRCRTCSGLCSTRGVPSTTRSRSCSISKAEGSHGSRRDFVRGGGGGRSG